MAHTKAGGSARINKDSNPKMLGIKMNDGEAIIPGMIIVRQRGSVYKEGPGVKRGKDFTLFAMTTGTVHFYKKHDSTYVSIVQK